MQTHRRRRKIDERCRNITTACQNESRARRKDDNLAKHKKMIMESSFIKDSPPASESKLKISASVILLSHVIVRRTHTKSKRLHEHFPLPPA